MNDRLIIRQLAQYPRSEAVEAGYVALLQAGEAGTPYVSITAADLVATALSGANGGRLEINADTGAIVFGPPDIVLNAVSGVFTFSAPVNAPSITATFIDAPSITVNGVNVATSADLAANRAASVTSFNLRTGDIMLMTEDILRAGGAPIRNAHFGGWITAPSVWDTRANDDTVATTNWVHRAIHDTGVSSFNCRTGDVTFTVADFNAATAAGPGFPTAPSPALGDASNRIATTLFVDESLQDLHLTISDEQLALLTSTYAPINSPQFTGIPTAPTASPGVHTGQIATTAFVMNAVTASTSGVSSFNTRTGAVTLLNTDISGAGGALLASPVFSGNPAAPTAAPGTATTQLATTAFVSAAITAAGGVTSFNTRTGAVTLSLADVTGTGVLANTPLTGVPTAPTAATATSTTQVATTAFVQAVLATGVTSFMGRTGAVSLIGADVSAAGGALINSPPFTGTPTAPTPATSDSSTTLATTAFVHAAITAGAAGVTTFNGRAGAVTLTGADITGVGGALSASPTFTGTVAISSLWQFDSAAGVPRIMSIAPAGGSYIRNSGSGSLTFQNGGGGALLVASDSTTSNANPGAYVQVVNGVIATPAVTQITTGGASPNRSLVLSAAGTGTVQAPTMAAGDSSAAIATTAFVAGTVRRVVLRTFTAAGAFTYTPSAGMVYCIVEAVGGGGGSGAATGGTTYVTSGGGGGGGAYARKLLTAAQVGASLTGSVGAGGAATVAGGDTSLGSSLVLAKGGAGGASGTTGALGTPGLGGSAASSLGDVVIYGGNGGGGPYFSVGAASVQVSAMGGQGGASMFAPPTPGILTANGAASIGASATLHGGGGAGACANNVAASSGGGAGSTGIVIITEFCSQ